MPVALDGRVAIVTGGGRGIGRAISQTLATAGAVVAVAGRSTGPLDETVASIERSGGRAFAVQVEVTDPRSVQAAVEAVMDRSGRIDILVNNAGIAGREAAAVDLPIDEWKRVVAVNLDGTFYCTKATLPYMIERGAGRIVNVTSLAGKNGVPNFTAYSSAKAGVIGFTKAVAKEVASAGILVNCVTPGVIETEIWQGIDAGTKQAMVAQYPLRRGGQPEEVAALVAWLCSDECSFSTGAVFDISGGRATY